MRTGDLGFIYENNLYVTGRLKDVIIIHGRNFYPQDIEFLVERSHDNIRLGGCAAFSIESNDLENLTIVCEVNVDTAEQDWPDMINAICRNIANEYEIPVAAIVFIDAKTLPKTTSGKVRRQPTKSAFLSNLLDVRHQWQAPTFSVSNDQINPLQDDALNWATQWIENHVHRKIDPKLTFIEQGFDSIAIVEFTQALSEQYELEIDPLIAWEYPHIDQFVKHAIKNQHISADKILTTKHELIAKNLSPGQLRLYYLHMMYPHSKAYNIAGAFRLQGNLSIDKFRLALQAMLTRHEILRTVISNAQPKIIEDLAVDLPVVDLSSKPNEKQDRKIKSLLQAKSNQPYDLNKGPLVRFLLIQLAPNDFIFLAAMHHIIFDGTSMFIFLREMLQIYEASVEDKTMNMPALPIQFYDFAHWQQERFAGNLKKSTLEFWTNYLADVSTNLQLPYDNVRSKVDEEPAIHRLRFNLPPRLSAQIEQYCKQSSITPFVFLLTAYQLLLTQYTNQNDFIIGIPTSGRTKAKVAQLIGFFVNTLPIRVFSNQTISISELLQNNGNMLQAVYKYQDVPLPELISALSIERDVDGQSLIQTMFVMQNEFQFNLSAPNLSITPYWSESGQLDYSLTMEVIPFSNRYQVVLAYDALLLEPDTIKRMAKHFRRLIKSMLSKKESLVGKLSLLDKNEFHKLIYDWNATDCLAPDYRTLHKLFEAQANITPDHPALVFEDHAVSYAELNSEANRYAHYLRFKGVKANDIVGIHLERSAEMIACLLAVLKAQGAYLYLDIRYPESRLNDLIEDSNCKLIIGASLHALPAAQHSRVITLNALQENSMRLSDENFHSIAEKEGDALAYVIYTSGSTGKPKGVLITHNNVCQRLYNLAQTSISVERVLHISNFTFDASVMSLWHPLIKGGTCLIPREEDMRVWDIKSLEKFIHSQKITSFFMTPTQLSTLLLGAKEENFNTIHDVLIGGEALKLDLVSRTKKIMKNAMVWNGYGPTECTIVSSIFLANDWKKANIPIGAPLPNDKYYVLNQDLSPVPIGVIGELYIGGKGVAMGYLNRADLTSSKFVPNPFAQDVTEKMYRTGDLVRWLPEGVIEYSGRIDNQVKIRGMRVELGEIEVKLLEHPQIKEAVVVVDKKESLTRIIAYLILENKPAINLDDIRNYLANHLPTHMLPNNYVMLDKFPINTNGKVDYRALPVVDSTPKVVTNDVNELNEVEEKLLSIFRKVLQHDNVDIYDNFFEVGGDSILSIHLTMLADEQNIHFTVQDLIKCPTVKELASIVTISSVHADKYSPATTGEIPLTPIQHWFMKQALMVPHTWVTLYQEFLASFVNHRAQTKELGVLIQLNKSQQQETIFCIHPVAGNVVSYAKLANLLETKYRLYGIQASGLEGESPPSHSIEEMATHYIKRIKTVQDRGPYKLVGWSMGGLIAFEMAVQLKAMGERVSFVNLIDVKDPLSMPQPESMNEKLFFYYLTKLIEDTLGDNQIKVMSWKIKLLFFLLKYNGSSYFVALVISYMMKKQEGVDPRHFKKFISMLKHDLSTTGETRFPIMKLILYMKRHKLLSGSIDTEQFVNFYEVYRANFYAVLNYTPKAYREKIVSFSAKDSFNIRSFNAPHNDIEHIAIPGNHFDVLRNLESLSIISKRLETESKAA